MLVTWSFRQRNSLMEKIDPRARWIFSILFLFSITQFWDLRILLVFFVLAFTWYLSARTTWRETRRGWLFILLILMSMVVVNVIITGGGTSGIVAQEGQHPIWGFTLTLPVTGWIIHFTLTIERVWFAIAQIVRILSISAVFLIIPYSMDPRLYGFTFHGLGLPDRFAYSMDLAFRYVPTLARDFITTLDAQKARGYEIERVEGGLVRQVRRVAPLIVPITMGSILTGEDVINAMDLRCFGLKKRTWVTITTYHWYDYVIIIFSVLLLLGSLFLRYSLEIGSFWVPTWILPS